MASFGENTAERSRRASATEVILIACIVAVGIAWRLVWLISNPDHFFTSGEAVNVAAAFAKTGLIAEAHGPGTGLTAHLNPVMPMIAGYVERIFGIESRQSAWMLTCLSLAILTSSALVLTRTLKLLGAKPRLALAFLASYMILPLFPNLEVIGFRHWEGGMAVLLASTTVLLLTVADKVPKVTLARSLLLSFVTAWLLFVSPPLALASYVCGAILLRRKVVPASWPLHAALAACMLAVVLAPWTIRNWEVFHQFIPLRSNFGLELAIAYHPEAASTDDASRTFQERLAAVHPLRNADAVGLLRREGGEARYAQKLGREAQAWMRQNPADAARLSVRYGSEYYFPRSWFWVANSHGTMAKKYLLWTISILGLLGALQAAVAWRGAWTYVAIFATVPSLPYFLVQPILRYCYIVYPFLLLLSFEVVCRYAVGLWSAQVHHRGEPKDYLLPPQSR